ncbi:MAG: hypothetical protein HYS57_01735 [Parcubacteria group bacterium]|nr:hypothetical protein [Parcubacteria group bacterium]
MLGGISLILLAAMGDGSTGAKPSLSLVAPASTTLMPTVTEILRFRIATPSTTDVIFKEKRGGTNIRLTVKTIPLRTAALNFKLFDAATNQQLGPTLKTEGVYDGQRVRFTQFDSTVYRGTTKEYYVTANLSNFTGVGDNFSVTLEKKEDFMWLDKNKRIRQGAEGIPLKGATFVKP